MPIYEYGCYDCRKRVSVFWRTISFAERGTPKCPRCGGTNLQRLVSKVSMVRSEESRLENLTDSAMAGGFDENDPKAMAKFMKKMTGELGDEMSEEIGPEFDEVIDRLEKGQNPEDIEREMPDLGNALPGGGAADDWNP